MAGDNTMNTLIGTNPDQVPVNGMLGTMAFKNVTDVVVSTTKLATARNINGVAFDGTQDVTIPVPNYANAASIPLGIGFARVDTKLYINDATSLREIPILNTANKLVANIVPKTDTLFNLMASLGSDGELASATDKKVVVKYKGPDAPAEVYADISQIINQIKAAPARINIQTHELIGFDKTPDLYDATVFVTELGEFVFCPDTYALSSRFSYSADGLHWHNCQQLPSALFLVGSDKDNLYFGKPNITTLYIIAKATGELTTRTLSGFPTFSVPGLVTPAYPGGIWFTKSSDVSRISGVYNPKTNLAYSFPALLSVSGAGDYAKVYLIKDEIIAHDKLDLYIHDGTAFVKLILPENIINVSIESGFCYVDTINTTRSYKFLLSDIITLGSSTVYTPCSATERLLNYTYNDEYRCAVDQSGYSIDNAPYLYPWLSTQNIYSNGSILGSSGYLIDLFDKVRLPPPSKYVEADGSASILLPANTTEFYLTASVTIPSLSITLPPLAYHGQVISLTFPVAVTSLSISASLYTSYSVVTVINSSPSVSAGTILTFVFNYHGTWIKK